MKKACRTKWLSLDNSVSSVYEDIEPLLKTVNNFNTDPIAIGLLKKMKNTKFFGAIYILKWVLPLLAQLSKPFQQGSLNFSHIAPAIAYTKAKLQESKEPLEQLRIDL